MSPTQSPTQQPSKATSSTPTPPTTRSTESQNLPATALQHVLEHPRSQMQPADILTLQRTIGNQAVQRLLKAQGEGSGAPWQTARPAPVLSLPAYPSAPLVQRVEESTAEYKDYSTLSVMPLSELDQYARKQADWHRGPLSDEERTHVRNVLRLARRDENVILTACGKFAVADLVETLSDDHTQAALLAYGKAAGGPALPFRLAPVKGLEEACQLGAAILQLSTIPAGILKRAMDEGAFRRLLGEKLVGDLVSYYASCTPIFEAADGQDIHSYIELRKEGKDPIAYKDSIPQMRNFHRFHGVVLDKLKENWQYKNKDRHVTLILQSAVDFNGFVHRHPGVKQVFEHDTILALVIEGKATVDEVTNQIGPIAREFAPNNKLDQVMIVGHGQARSMQLAGTQSNNDQPIKESLDLDGNLEATNRLFDALLENMNVEGDDPVAPHLRVVFNACLTNSNMVPLSEKLDKSDFKGSSEKVRAYIKTHASLATYFQNRAKEKNSKVTSVGANAAVSRYKLINSTDTLDLIATPEAMLEMGNTEENSGRFADPVVAGSKLEYVRRGKNSIGVMRAVVESLAGEGENDYARCIEEMRDRLADDRTRDWDETIICSLYEIILNGKGAGEVLSTAHQAASIVPGLFALLHTGSCRLALLKGIMGLLQPEVAEEVSATLLPTLMKFCAAVPFHHTWLVLCQYLIPTHIPWNSLFGYLESNFTCASVTKPDSFLDFAILEQRGVTGQLTSPMNKGQLMFVLTALGLGNSSLQKTCKTFLSGFVEDGKFKPDIQEMIQEMIEGFVSESILLSQLSGNKIGDDPEEEIKYANVQVEGGTEGKNTIYVEPLTQTGTTKPDSAPIYGYFPSLPEAPEKRKNETFEQKTKRKQAEQKRQEAYDEIATDFDEILRKNTIGTLPKGSRVNILGLYKPGIGENLYAFEYQRDGNPITALIDEDSVKIDN